MARRRTCQLALTLLALFLVGTVVVLSTVSFYLKIDPEAYLSEQDLVRDQRKNLTQRIPRILHQTWKTEILPDKWSGISQDCRDMMPDYEYKIWTDEGSRKFINEHYPWFSSTFDAYKYPIQRADAIRYFVLHHFGGIYLDLDIGCLKPLDPLLSYPVILPKTIPVGVSNDLMFAEPRHPFLQQTIHNLVTFDHSWVLNYPTVMFSTGPMFLSAQYGLYNSVHMNEVRIMPKSLYGKNAKPEDVPDSFFTHYYGSSWHADDAGFITFLGKWGKALMWVGVLVLVGGVVRLLYVRRSKVRAISARRRRLIGRYDIILPRVFQRSESTGDVRPVFLSPLSAGNSTSPSSCSSPVSTRPPSPILTSPPMPLLYESDVPLSPVSDETEVVPTTSTSYRFSAVQAVDSARAWLKTAFGSNQGARRRPAGRRRRSTLFFLPAIFTPSSRPAIRIHDQEDVDIPFIHTTPPVSVEDDSWHTYPGTSGPNLDSGLTRSKSPRRQIEPYNSNPPPPYESDAESGPRAYRSHKSQWSQWEGEELP